jgi:hypothetical protein
MPRNSVVTTTARRAGGSRCVGRRLVNGVTGKVRPGTDSRARTRSHQRDGGARFNCWKRPALQVLMYARLGKLPLHEILAALKARNPKLWAEVEPYIHVNGQEPGGRTVETGTMFGATVGARASLAREAKPEERDDMRTDGLQSQDVNKAKRSRRIGAVECRCRRGAKRQLCSHGF